MATWYHITDSWKASELTVAPRKCYRPDTTLPIDSIPCIHVCPTIAQCILAIGDWSAYSELRIYKTDTEATAATYAFDYSVTEEHKIFQPTVFQYIKSISVEDLIDAGMPKTKIWEIADDTKAVLSMAKVMKKLQSDNMKFLMEAR